MRVGIFCFEKGNPFKRRGNDQNHRGRLPLFFMEVGSGRGIIEGEKRGIAVTLVVPGFWIMWQPSIAKKLFSVRSKHFYRFCPWGKKKKHLTFNNVRSKPPTGEKGGSGSTGVGTTFDHLNG